jgi:cytochrome c
LADGTGWPRVASWRVAKSTKGKEIGMLRWVVAAGLLVALPAAASAQDAEAGKKVFNKCAPCHSIGPGAKNKVGPELNGLVGRQPGTVAGFNYSDAMKKYGEKVKAWDDALFHKYIEDPKKEVPGNKMVFPGVKDELERDDLAAYIETFNADGSTK